MATGERPVATIDGRRCAGSYSIGPPSYHNSVNRLQFNPPQLRGFNSKDKCTMKQARREGEVEGKLPRAPRRLGGPAVGQKYKVRQNVLFWKEKFENILPRGASRKCFSGPRCGSRRACYENKQTSKSCKNLENAQT